MMSDGDMWRRIERWYDSRAGRVWHPSSETSLPTAVTAQPERTRPIRTCSIRLDRGRETQTPCGPCWTWSAPLVELTENVARTLHALRTSRPCTDPVETCDCGDAELHRLATTFPTDTLFVDIETCGLAGSAVFLIGLIHGTQDGPIFTQLFARTYAEEPAILMKFGESLSSARVLVTFNGKSFDWPILQDRITLHFWQNTRGSLHSLVPESGSSSSHSLPPDHVDLLRLFRRRCRGKFSDFRLQTLERLVCGRWRTRDVPGSEIPLVYRDFVLGKCRELMETILLHNALDLLTSFELAGFLIGTTHRR